MKGYYQIEKCTTIPDLINKRIEKYSDSPLFVYWNKDHSRQITVSAKEFEKQVASLGNWFIKQGFHKKRIAIYGENSYDWLLSFFAIVCTGNTAVLPDYHLQKDALEKLLLHSACDAVCFSSTYNDVAKDLENSMGISCCAFADLHQIAQCGEAETTFEKHLNEPVSSEDLAVIAYTSGATGDGKGVMLTHGNLLADWQGTAKQLDASGRKLLLLPLYHLFSMSTMMIAFMWGGIIYICSSVRYIVSDIITVRPRIICAVPAMLPVLYQTFEKINEDYGARVICGGAPADYGWKSRFNAIHVHMYFGYGMTECGPIIATDSELFDTPDGAMKVLETNEVRIDCPDENGIGEVLVKGPNVMRGYCKMPEETAAVLQDGWMHTGDLGRLDKDGFLTITGRKKDLLILPNGENIAPEELERKVMTIAGVSECMAYLQEEAVTMEIYAPDNEENSIRDEVYRINETLSASHRMRIIIFRNTPFERNSMGKMIRK